jgi:hypothetical protein
VVERDDDADRSRVAVVDVETVGEPGDQPGVLAVRRGDPQVVVGTTQHDVGF